ncbi:hypothetical protein [Rhizobium herbae]
MRTLPLPLFDWKQLTEAERLQYDRELLLSRIQKLRPHAHQRLALEERIRAITLQQIALENALYGEKRP